MRESSLSGGRVALGGCVLALALAAAACDRTKLSGHIGVGGGHPTVGKTVELRLSVPENLEAIYWVSWTVHPPEAGTIEYHQYDRSAGADSPDARGKLDRVARFTPSRPGPCRIETTGYFKQTNPQPITSLELLVAAP